MNYELAKELKSAGFPQGKGAQYHTDPKAPYFGWIPGQNDREHKEWIRDYRTYFPTLSELIEACGEDFFDLTRWHENGSLWHATSNGQLRPDMDDDEHKGTRCEPGCCGLQGKGPTPEEAVARLWLALNKHD